eukprot:Skav216735  [mRNA]  locus=scaffold653:224122:224772:+ [translate_table: standard]
MKSSTASCFSARQQQTDALGCQAFDRRSPPEDHAQAPWFGADGGHFTVIPMDGFRVIVEASGKMRIITDQVYTFGVWMFQTHRNEGSLGHSHVIEVVRPSKYLSKEVVGVTLRRECETDVIHQTFAKHYAELFNQDWQKRSEGHKRGVLSLIPMPNQRPQEVHRHAVESGLGRCGAHDIDFLLTHVPCFAADPQLPVAPPWWTWRLRWWNSPTESR